MQTCTIRSRINGVVLHIEAKVICEKSLQKNHMSQVSVVNTVSIFEGFTFKNPV